MTTDRHPLLGLVVLLVVTAALAWAPTARAATTVDLTAPATALAFGADGAVWHVTADGRVGRATASGAGGSWALGPDVAPVDIAAGWDGTMWVIDRAGVLRAVSPGGHIVEVADLDAPATAVAIGWDGVPWVALRRTIARVTPDGAVTRYDTGANAAPRDIVAAWDGTMWFADGGRIARVDLSGNVSDVAEADAVALAAGADRAMWFTTQRAIHRIDGFGPMIEYALPGKPGAFVTGADGALYFALNKALGRITTAGELVTVGTGDSHPGALVSTPDGALWFADAQAPELARITAVSPPAPTLSVSVHVEPSRGDVRIKRPSGRFQPLRAGVTIPVGSVVDTRNGAVELVSAINRRGRLQTGRFHGGLFKVRQRRSGLVRLLLRGRLSCGDGEAVASRRRRKRRRLWGSDSGGLFSTLGLDSITTVRGTRWLTEDRCGGTLTAVTEGSVVVRNRRTGERVVVRAGERYFARHRR